MISDGARRGLILQGFACDEDPKIADAARWLRFTPAVSTLCIIAGTVLRAPGVLWAFAVVAAIGSLGWNAFDQIFNSVVRPWLHAPPLPRNPAPRRFAMAVAAAWSAVAGLLLWLGPVWAGLTAGAALAVAGGTVATTHFCLGSWMYRRLRGDRPRNVAT